MWRLIIAIPIIALLGAVPWIGGRSDHPFRHQHAAGGDVGSILEYSWGIYRLRVFRKFSVLRARHLRHGHRHGSVQSAVLAWPRRWSNSRDHLCPRTWHSDLAAAGSLFRYCDAWTVSRDGRGLRQSLHCGGKYRPDPSAHSGRRHVLRTCARASGGVHRCGRLDVEQSFRNGAYRDT